jgi:hypothetical protein
MRMLINRRALALSGQREEGSAPRPSFMDKWGQDGSIMLFIIKK